MHEIEVLPEHVRKLVDPLIHLETSQPVGPLSPYKTWLPGAVSLSLCHCICVIVFVSLSLCHCHRDIVLLSLSLTRFLTSHLVTWRGDSNEAKLLRKELNEVPRDLDSTCGNRPEVSSGGARHLARVQALHLLRVKGLQCISWSLFHLSFEGGNFDTASCMMVTSNR